MGGTGFGGEWGLIVKPKRTKEEVGVGAELHKLQGLMCS